MFENKKINDIHATRYIVSWIREGGQLHYLSDADNFYNWLLSIGVSKDDARYIKELATNGKMELENSAKIWLSKTTH